MIWVTLNVTPRQAADLVSGAARAVVTMDDVTPEMMVPQVVRIACPEIGWAATAYAYDVVRTEPQYLMALDISKRVEAKRLGTTKLKLMHMFYEAKRSGNLATVFCLRRVEDDETGGEPLLSAAVEGEASRAQSRVGAARA